MYVLINVTNGGIEFGITYLIKWKSIYMLCIVGSNNLTNFATETISRAHLKNFGKCLSTQI